MKGEKRVVIIAQRMQDRDWVCGDKKGRLKIFQTAFPVSANL